ncbi:protease complex subunit PrcB family protein [Methanocaldococcus sp. 28A]
MKKDIIILLFTVILCSVTLCGCISFEKNISEKNKIKYYNIKNNIYSNSNISKNQSIQNTTNNTIDNIDNKTNLPKTLNYEIIAYGAFGEKSSGYYYYYEDNKTIIVINLGEMPTAGYKIKIINITETNNRIVVYYKVVPPKEFAAMVITYPYIKISVNGTYEVECKEIKD